MVRAQAEAAADPLALEAGAARALGLPGHHSGERPWSVTEAHQAPGQVTPHPPPTPFPALTSGSEVKADLSAAWPERSGVMTQSRITLRTPGAGPRSSGEVGRLASPAQAPPHSMAVGANDRGRPGLQSQTGM